MSERRAIFSPRVRTVSWVLCGISAIGTVIAILVGSRFAPTEATQTDSFTVGPIGHRAFVETLQGLSIDVFQDRRGAYTEVRTPLLFIEPNGTEVEVDGEVWTLRRILDERARRDLRTVVVLPKWQLDDGSRGVAQPHPRVNDVLNEVLPGARLDYLGSLDDEMEARRAEGVLGSYRVKLPWPQLIDAGQYATLLAVDGRALVVDGYDGVIVVTDPDLLHSWNLHRADHAALLHHLVTTELASDTVTIDEVFHDHGLELSLPMALGEWPTVLLTAQVLVCILLLVLIGAKRFGRPKEIAALAQGPGESIAVSAFVLCEGRPLGALAEAYVCELLLDLSQRLGLAPGRPPEEQATHIDQVARRRGLTSDATALLSAARAVALDKRRAKRDAMTVARQASALRRRILSREKETR